jgi:hypothetical protein
MEKKTEQKEEGLSLYQQSIQKFTEQIMDFPGNFLIIVVSLDKFQTAQSATEAQDKKPVEAKEEIKQSPTKSTSGVQNIQLQEAPNPNPSISRQAVPVSNIEIKS